MNTFTSVLLVEDHDDLRNLMAILVRQAMPEASVLHAHSGLAAIELFEAHQHTICLVVLDIELSGIVPQPGELSGREVCLKIRELNQRVPILPCTVHTEDGALLADFGCAPVFPKHQMMKNIQSFVERVQATVASSPLPRVSPQTLSYVAQLADAMRATAQTGERLRVVLVCWHSILRTALLRALEAVPAVVLGSVKNERDRLALAPLIPKMEALVGMVDDVATMRSIAALNRVPILVVAVHGGELDRLTIHDYRSLSVMLDEDGEGNLLQEAVAALQRGEQFLALPPAAIARIVPPLEGMPGREWDVVIAGLVTDDARLIASLWALEPSTVESYWSRARRRLGGSREELHDEVRRAIVAGFGVMPQIVLGRGRERSVGDG